jgi:fumarate reductase flavoprotein subunit
MPDYEPEKMELASRDVVSRRMEEHIRAGHGARSRFGEHLWLDIRLLGAEHINSRLREVKEICQHFLGIDPAQSLIPCVRRSTTPWAVFAPTIAAPRRTTAGCSPPARRPAGICTASTASVATPSPRPWSPGMLVGEYIADFCDSDAAALRSARRWPATRCAAQAAELPGGASADPRLQSRC